MALTQAQIEARKTALDARLEALQNREEQLRQQLADKEAEQLKELNDLHDVHKIAKDPVRLQLKQTRGEVHELHALIANLLKAGQPKQPIEVGFILIC
jgi:thiamine monophosphate synthase